MIVECVNFGCVNYASIFLGTTDGCSIGILVCKECSIKISQKIIGFEKIVEMKQFSNMDNIETESDINE